MYMMFQVEKFIQKFLPLHTANCLLLTGSQAFTSFK